MTFNPFTTNPHQLTIGAFKASDLARTYGTPLYVMDEALIRATMQGLMKAAKASSKLSVMFVYASKAFLNLAMAKLVDEEGFGLDVVSGGELTTALKVNFPPQRIVFHGNNKSRDELALALAHHVGLIILDNPYELEVIRSLQPTKPVEVMLRVNPELVIDTHAYITTGHEDSKFGMSLADPNTFKLIHELHQDPLFDLKGLHVHLGSQLVDEDTYHKAIDALVRTYHDLAQVGVELPWLNLGGGFGVAYTREDRAMDVNHALKAILSHLDEALASAKLTLSKVLFEPGRAIVANAGITLYTINALKETLRGKQYLFVDGSMADHIRTALYQARYEAALVDRLDDEPTQVYTVAGKACESGDILIHEVALPKVKAGDILAVFSTGAYHYSMASHYNRLPKPAVVFIRGEQIRVVHQRESYEDLLRQDRL